MHLSVQQIKHCSGGHILPSLTLWLSLPVSWCPLAPAHHIIYSPMALHDYYTDNMKLNYSLTVSFPSLAGKWTLGIIGVWSNTVLWAYSFFSYEKSTHRECIFFSFFIKPNFTFLPHLRKKFHPLLPSSFKTQTLPPGNTNTIVQTDQSLSSNQSSYRLERGPFGLCPGHAVNLFSQTPNGMDLALSHAPVKNCPWADDNS